MIKPKSTDVRVTGATVYFLPVRTRVPLKFGPETLTEVTCARVSIRVADTSGRSAEGWGETPLSAQWAWPGKVPLQQRCELMKAFTLKAAEAWTSFWRLGHPIELGYDFAEEVLPQLLGHFWLAGGAAAEMPRLAALVCSSPLDIALHDAYGRLLGRPVYETYTPALMNRDLAAFFGPVDGEVNFQGKFPTDYLPKPSGNKLAAWHLVGGLDLLETGDLKGTEPQDGYPVVLTDWIKRDGLKCLKIKLRGTDATWDYSRLVKVGDIALRHGVQWLSADFNCTVTNPAYVTLILDHLAERFPRVYQRLLYVEQPFPYDLERYKIDVRDIAQRKPLFLDESAHDWRAIKLGYELGWSGVALKTCKTQSGAILGACWARSHGMSLMVQDLTNPMLAQIPHVLLARHVGTIMGVETNAMQFYPNASSCEEPIHPGLYRRRGGELDLGSIRGPGFGYRLEEMRRTLPPPAATYEA